MPKHFDFGNKWDWEIKELLQQNNAQIGDIVDNVGYITDYNIHNYKSAVIENIRKIKYYPSGNIDEWIIKWQIFYKFEDGIVTQ